MESNKSTGIVKWFNSARGYGFIKVNGRKKKDLFVHYSGIQGKGHRDLIEGQKVEFEIQTMPRGDQAIEVKII